jgi:tetraprenyl-beta-curcumene synthase
MPVSVSNDRSLAMRTSLALALANVRYWTMVAPLVETELNRWRRHARAIPNPTLQLVALENLREEGFNARAAATLATLAPRRHRRSVVEAIVGLQTIYDYLDSLVERPLVDPLVDGLRLYHAFIDAVLPYAEHRDAYYPTTDPGDGGYLAELVCVVRRALAGLPRLDAVSTISRCAAERCAEAQVRAHATHKLGSAQLERWAQSQAADTGVEWPEFLAGAISSGLALHALIAAAADSRTSSEQAIVIDRAYLSISALTTLLDSVVDYEEDMSSTGQPGYLRYYPDRDALVQGLGIVLRSARARTREAPHEAHHLMILLGIVAYYSSAPAAADPWARLVTDEIGQEVGPLIRPTLAIMRTWRVLERARAAIAN